MLDTLLAHCYALNIAGCTEIVSQRRPAPEAAPLFADYLVLYTARRGAQALVARGTLISQTLRAKHDGSIAARVKLGDEVLAAPWPANHAVPLKQVLAESKLLVRTVRARQRPWIGD